MHSYCNIRSGTYNGVDGQEGGRVGSEGVGSQRQVILSVRTIRTSYESKKCQPKDHTCLEGLRDVPLPQGSISDSCLLCSALHGPNVSVVTLHV